MISLGDSSFQKMEVLTMNVLSSVHTLMAGNRCLRKLQTINLYCMPFWLLTCVSHGIGVSDVVKNVISTISSIHIYLSVCSADNVFPPLYGTEYAPTHFQTDCCTC